MALFKNRCLSSKSAMLLMSASAGVLMAGTGARAAEGTPQIEELIVTAQKRAESVQDVPISISAYSGERLEAAGVQNFRELSDIVPNLRMEVSNSARNTTVSIRGIGSSGTNPGIENSVGLFLDGSYLSGAGALQSDLLDIESVQVLRGPQGTLYGRNTPVGAINIVTREPKATPEGMLVGGLGDYENRYIKGYVGGGLSETVAGRVSFWARKRSGFEHNLFSGEDVNDFQGVGGRARLKWEPSDTLKVNLIGYFGRTKVRGGVAEQLDPSSPGGIAKAPFLAAVAAQGYTFRNYSKTDHVVDSNEHSNDNIKSYGASVTADWDLAGGHTVTSITSWDVYYGKVNPLAADALPMNLGTVEETGEATSYSEELRIASPTGGRLEYLGGLFLYSNDTWLRASITVGPDANRLFPLPAAQGGPAPFRPGDATFTAFDQTTKSAAVFGTATLRLTPQWRVTAGARYNRDEKDATINHTTTPSPARPFLAVFGPNPIGNVTRDEGKATWSLNTQYDLADDIMLFASASTGSKSGGFNARRQAAGTPVQFEDESSIDYELGFKSRLLDRRLMLNVTAFRIELNNFQESVVNPVTRVGFIVGNAGQRTGTGVEIDGEAALTSELRLSGGMAYLDAQYTDYASGPCYAGRVADGALPGTCNFNGLTPSGSPRWKANLAADWTHPLGNGLTVALRGEMTYTSALFLDGLLDPRSRQAAVTVFNGRLTLRPDDGPWSATLWGKNLTDEAYFQRTPPQPLTLFANAGGTAAPDGYNGYYAEPRTWGIELSYRY